MVSCDGAYGAMRRIHEHSVQQWPGFGGGVWQWRSRDHVEFHLIQHVSLAMEESTLSSRPVCERLSVAKLTMQTM